MGDNNNLNQNHNNDNDDTEERFCSICHRSEKDTGTLVDIPGGLHLCPDCMQKMINTASSIDYDSLMDQLRNGKVPTMPGMEDWLRNIPGSNYNAPQSTDQNKTPEKTQETASGETSGDGDTDKSDEEDDEKKKKGHPNVSFINLGDLFGGYGGGTQPKVKKKKKTGPKPVFTYDNIPAPHLLKAELDKYVIGQEQAKKTISVAAYNHYKRVKTGTMDDIEIGKSNILLIGPTGSGKTYLVKTLARLLDVPLAITDATNLTEAGYIGDDVESCISKLLAAADNDVDKAEKGIVFIDEIDKLAKKQNMNSRDVSGEAVQQGLLKLLEGSEVEVPVGANSKNGMVPLTTVDTTNILFICGGAFDGLEKIIHERTDYRSMGFNASVAEKEDRNISETLKQVLPQDLVRFGMIPEFIGRVPVVVSLDGLDRNALVRILKEPKNALVKQYAKLFDYDHVKLSFEDDALEEVADLAVQRNTGARGLRSIMEKAMMDVMYTIPSDPTIRECIVTKAAVDGTGAPLLVHDDGSRTEVLPGEESLLEQKPAG